MLGRGSLPTQEQKSYRKMGIFSLESEDGSEEEAGELARPKILAFPNVENKDMRRKLRIFPQIRQFPEYPLLSGGLLALFGCDASK